MQDVGAAQAHPPPLSLSLPGWHSLLCLWPSRMMFALGEGGPLGGEWGSRRQERIPLALKTSAEHGGFLAPLSSQVEKSSPLLCSAPVCPCSGAWQGLGRATPTGREACHPQNYTLGSVSCVLCSVSVALQWEGGLCVWLCQVAEKQHLIAVEASFEIVVFFRSASALVRDSVSVIKLRDQKQKIYFSLQLSGHTPSRKDVRAGTRCRNLVSGADAKAMDECCLLVWFSLLPYSIQDHQPRGGTPPPIHTHMWAGALWYQSSIKKMHQRSMWWWWWEHFVNWSSVFPNDSSLCQVDIKAKQHPPPQSISSLESMSIKDCDGYLFLVRQFLGKSQLDLKVMARLWKTEQKVFQ